jgi:ribosomal protein L12E/L44/L45/RPP1/RPP2
MANYSYTDNTIAELVADIGESEEELKRVLKKDRAYINRLVVLGYTREEAERYSFIGDLQNILSLMRSHQFSAKTAARLLRQTPDSPYEFESTEEEDEETEDEEEEPTHAESDTTPSYPSSPSTSHLRSSCSITSSSSSEDDTPAARKRLKLDPDYVPSENTTPADTAASSQVSSESEREEEEEEEETEETDTESYGPSDTKSDGDNL